MCFDEVEFFVEDVLCIEDDFLIEVMVCVVVYGVNVFNVFDMVGVSEFGEICCVFECLMWEVEWLEYVIFLVYCYNDFGLVVFNSLVVVQVGVCQVECVINGIGEWVGNCLLEELVMVLNVCLDIFLVVFCVDIIQLWLVSQKLMCLIGVLVVLNKVIVGKNVFVYEVGIYQYGMIVDCCIYEIMILESVGVLGLELVLGKYFGKYVLNQCFVQLGYQLDLECLNEVFCEFKCFVDVYGEVIDVDLVSLMEGYSESGLVWQVMWIELCIIVGFWFKQFVCVELLYFDCGWVFDIVLGEGFVVVVFVVVQWIIGCMADVVVLEIKMLCFQIGCEFVVEIEVDLEGQCVCGWVWGFDVVIVVIDFLFFVFECQLVLYFLQ